MKIKHWQGYGTVNAKKLTDYPVNYAKHKAIIKITGNHECGIVREDAYDIFRWLGKLLPGCSDYRDIADYAVIPGSEKLPDGSETDTAIYEVTYWTR